MQKNDFQQSLVSGMALATGDLRGKCLAQNRWLAPFCSQKNEFRILVQSRAGPKLYVRDQFHGTGIALALLKSALHAAAGSGFDVVWLCVWERNPRALAFYRKSGFEVVGEVVIPMNGVPFRDLVMQARVT